MDACLAALERQSLPRGRFEIIVVDNASPCGASAVETAIAGRALLVVEHERGAGPARNRGVVEARHPLLAFIDSDCIPDDGWLEAGTAALDRADMVGGAVSVSVRNPAAAAGRKPSSRSLRSITGVMSKRNGLALRPTYLCGESCLGGSEVSATGCPKTPIGAAERLTQAALSFSRNEPGLAIQRGLTGRNWSGSGAASIWRALPWRLNARWVGCAGLSAVSRYCCPFQSTQHRS